MTNIEIQKYYQNESRFNGVYARDNSPRHIKDVTYVIILDEYADAGTHWIALYLKDNKATYFDSFGFEHLPKEIKNCIKNKNTEANTYRIPGNNSRMCGYFCTGIVDFMLAGKNLIDYASLFSPYDFRKMTISFQAILKMIEVPNTHLSNQTQFRLNKINEIKSYFIADIQEGEATSRRLSKYFAAFDCFDKALSIWSS